MVELEVKDEHRLQAADVVWFPTVKGFRNEPGCSESFQATAAVRSWSRDKSQPSGLHTIDYQLDLCALEFGGTFQQEQKEFQDEIRIFNRKYTV
mmetsp:Transcript_30906/g.48442  ORF Transcript_30906/g.48442 Transcript_30906/m.48442 type:complete len:94 (-) Transcript_30906:1136-1417(-)